MSAAVRTTGLCKYYGRVHALDDVNVELAEGSATWVAGPNGAGKSTLLRVLAARTRPTRGHVEVLGTSLFGRDAPRVRGRIGYAGPETGLYAELSVTENLRFAAALLGQPAPGERADALCALGLTQVAERPVRALSQGYRRRASLALALAGDPALLLLDEPWNGLDVEAAAQLAALLRSERARGRTLVVAAHAPPDADGLFDATLQLRAGRLA